jgi:hypothetical protein
MVVGLMVKEIFGGKSVMIILLSILYLDLFIRLFKNTKAALKSE